MAFFGVVLLVLYAFWLWGIAYFYPATESPEVSGNRGKRLSVSLLVVMRNEESALPVLVRFIGKQRVPDWMELEVLFVDDHSNDGGVALLHQLTRELSVRYKILANRGEGKKFGVCTGIEASSGDVILMTDADCWGRSDRWVATMTECFLESDVSMGVGIVEMVGTNLVGRWAGQEFWAVVQMGISSIRRGMPLYANAANMAFRRDLIDLDRIEAILGVGESASGDDVYLLNYFNSLPDMGRIVVVDSPDALISTHAPASSEAVIRQRLRWASKWRRSGNRWSTMGAVAIWIWHLAWIGALFALFSQHCLYGGLMLMMGKLLAEVAFFTWTWPKGNWKQVSEYAALLLAQPIYSFYVVALGIAVQLFPRYSWKGRRWN